MTKKSNSKFYLAHLKLLTYFLLKDSKQRFWHWKSLQKAACDSVKSYRKPLWLVNSWAFLPAASERSALMNTGQSQRREFWWGFQYAFSKLMRNFKVVNKTLIIVKGSEKPLKDLETHQRIHRKYWLKCLDLPKYFQFVTLSLKITAWDIRQLKAVAHFKVTWEFYGNALELLCGLWYIWKISE